MLQCCGISLECCRNKFKIDLFSYQLSNEKIARRDIRKHPKSVVHAFHVAKGEEKELRILDGLSKDVVYSVLEINTSSKWCSYHYSKSHNTVDCKAHINRSKLATKRFNYNEDHFIKACPKSKRTIAEKSQHSDQTIHTTFSTSTHIPVDMWQDINKKIGEVKIKK